MAAEKAEMMADLWEVTSVAERVAERVEKKVE